jgi:hypothetical protein
MARAASTTQESADGGGAERDKRLVKVLGRARRQFQFRLTDQMLLMVGGAFVVAGILAIVLGWVGASNTILVAGQIPYLVSGGLLGLALVFLGAFLYFAYWVTTLVRQGERRAADDERRNNELLGAIADTNRQLLALAAAVEELGGTVPRRSTGASRSSGSRATAGDRNGGGSRPRFVATMTGSMFHRPDCAVVAGKANVRAVDPSAPGMTPCGICDPLGLREPVT